MKPKPAITNRTIKLTFMDVSVSLTGNKNLESKALKMLGALIQDRLKVFELIENIDHSDEAGGHIPKDKKVKPAITKEFLKGYA